MAGQQDFSTVTNGELAFGGGDSLGDWPRLLISSFSGRCASGSGSCALLIWRCTSHAGRQDSLALSRAAGATGAFDRLFARVDKGLR